MLKNDFKVQVAGVDSLILYFGDVFEEKVFEEVQNCFVWLEENIESGQLQGILEIVPSYTSIFIQYDLLMHDFTSIKNLLYRMIEAYPKNRVIACRNQKCIEIPVYYGLEVGYDLNRITQEKRLSIEEIIALHSQREYRVCAIGFAPGFAYMASVDQQLQMPRLTTPRKKVPKGSVAVADQQTAIYPKASPGGWNIIGRTYVELFDKSYPNYSRLKVGDSVRFVSIPKVLFLERGGVLDD
jgi:KipI family sensor histidine kinase inhibitor